MSLLNSAKGEYYHLACVRVVLCKQLRNAIFMKPVFGCGVCWAMRASRLPIKVPVDSMVLYVEAYTTWHVWQRLFLGWLE